MRFLANENYPYPSIKILRGAGHDVKSIGEEMHGISDVNVLDVAKKENRIILTLDKDYGELIYRHKTSDPPAIIFYRYKGLGPEYAGLVLIDIINADQIHLENNFTVIEQKNVRQRSYNL